MTQFHRGVGAKFKLDERSVAGRYASANLPDQ
jgi:hypothetical protein